MIDRVQLISIAISLLLLVAVLELVRRRRLVEEYSIIWILGALVLLAASVWRGFLDTAARFLGIYYPPSLDSHGPRLVVLRSASGPLGCAVETAAPD